MKKITGFISLAVVILAIAVFLNMSKEIAKNTWSTKEYLKRISESLNEGQ